MWILHNWIMTNWELWVLLHLPDDFFLRSSRSLQFLGILPNVSQGCTSKWQFQSGEWWISRSFHRFSGTKTTRQTSRFWNTGDQNPREKTIKHIQLPSISNQIHWGQCFSGAWNTHSNNMNVIIIQSWGMEREKILWNYELQPRVASTQPVPMMSGSKPWYHSVHSKMGSVDSPLKPLFFE